MRYKAWGETRYASGTTQTKYQYTGQYSYTADFGLHFYNARWYDSSLSRFAQADTVVPSGVQGYDRYAYVNNSPVRYTDPTGHWCEPGDFEPGGYCYSPSVSESLTQFGISPDGLTETQQSEALRGARYFGQYYYQTYRSQYGFTSPQDAFRQITGGNISIILDESRSDCETIGSTITCDSGSINMNALVHEYFHVFDNNYNTLVPDTCYAGSDCLASNYTPGEWVADVDYYDSAYKCNDFECISHPQWLGNFYSYEAFANAGQNWILEGLKVNEATSGFASNQYGDAIRKWMNENIPAMLNRMFP
jgi:RHS repeat-associated protein